MTEPFFDSVPWHLYCSAPCCAPRSRATSRGVSSAGGRGDCRMARETAAYDLWRLAQMRGGGRLAGRATGISTRLRGSWRLAACTAWPHFYRPVRRTTRRHLSDPPHAALQPVARISSSCSWLLTPQPVIELVQASRDYAASRLDARLSVHRALASTQGRCAAIHIAVHVVASTIELTLERKGLVAASPEPPDGTRRRTSEAGGRTNLQP